MATGIHWEWRGFGAVGSQFADTYAELPVATEHYTADDLYLWIPGLDVNAKLRTNADGDLKFKRLENKDGDLEKWQENPDEIFDFPLTQEAWETLTRTLSTVDIQLADKLPSKAGRKEILSLLRSKGCKTIHVKKHRESRLWQGSNGAVSVEWACISSPQPLISIGLEGWSENAPMPDELEKEDLASAINVLQLENEPLRVMNYLEAVQVWAKGKKL